MKYQPSCAEKLFLVGEMLSTADQYLQECKGAADHDDETTVNLAAEELDAIRIRCAQLGAGMARLQKKLQERGGETP